MKLQRKHNKHWFQVRDGVDQTAPFIGRYCGSTVPSQVVSSGKTIWVRFFSDSTTTRSGFTARVQAVETPCGGPVTLTNVTSTADPVVITSPSHPSPYPSTVHCRWVVQAASSRPSSLEFHFTDLDMSSSQR